MTHPFIRTYASHKPQADQAFSLFASWCDRKPTRIPGMDTPIRMAWRLAHGKTVEQAAAREYVYRWELVLKPFHQIDGRASCNPRVSVFGTPHTLGM